ncbi:MAG TPA: manganese efflux pump [Candidatus Dormibacteraeota bacterium]
MAALVLPLCLDTFAISAAAGVQRPSRAQRLRVGALFAVFEGGMPLVGLVAGLTLAQLLAGAAEYLAIAVLAVAGLLMLRGDDDDAEDLASTHGWRLLLLGLSVSLDELAIGFTLGLLRVPALLVAGLIALQAFAVSQLGLALGALVAERLREGAERLAGVFLLALAAFLLVTHF